MLDLPPSPHSHSFLGLKPSIPLMIGLEFSLKPTFSSLSEWKFLNELQTTRRWNFDLNSLRFYLKDTESAIVITDPTQAITWASQGFRRMTGYEHAEAYGKRPNFLQGEKTSEQTRQQIRQHLANRQDFTGQIVNYRKSGEAYLCAIHLFPVFNQSRELVNFIALEKEEPMDSQIF